MGKTKEIDVLALGASPNKQKHLDKMQARIDEQRARLKADYDRAVKEQKEHRKKSSANAYRNHQERDA